MSSISRLTDMVQRARVEVKCHLLRNSLYHFGNNVYLHKDVTFNFPEKIYISDDCNLYKGVIINARSEKDIGVKLGKAVKIHEYTYVDSYGGEIFLDDYSGIGHHCVIAGHGGLNVGKYCMIAGLTYIIPANHNFNRTDIPYLHQGETKKEICIGDNVWIGGSCTLLAGINIGENSIIGAGSVVSKDIPKNSLAVGVPAKVIKVLK